jgi:RNA polymerase sigma-70 factor (ECF subfamily)
LTPALLQRIAAGDTQAFAELVEMHQGPLFGFLGRMGCPQAQAEDLAQETFLRAWTQLPRYQPDRAEFNTWLFTIARNLACNALQSAAQRHETPGEALPEVACTQPNPEHTLDQLQQSARLQAALRQLPIADRSALALVYVQDLALADVARIEGDSLAAIKTRLHRAKQRLRALLANDTEKPYDYFHDRSPDRSHD